MRILILYAFDNEVNMLKERLTLSERQVNHCNYAQGRLGETDIYMAKTGIGTTRASVITTRLSLALKPDIIFFIGTAGGLKPGLHTGDIFIGDKIVDIDLVHLPSVLTDTPYAPCLIEPHHEVPIKLTYQLDPSLLEHFIKLDFPKVLPGTIATSNTFPAPKEALAIMKELDSSIIEMEGSGLCYAAYHDDTPLVVIRAVSNNLDDNGNDLGTPEDALVSCSTRLADFMITILESVPTLQSNPALRMGTKAAKAVSALIATHELKPYPAGGFYNSAFPSTLLVSPIDETNSAVLPDLDKKRAVMTSSYFLLTSDCFSAWRKIKSEEVWHYYKGSPLIIHTINDETGQIESIQLGNPLKHDTCTRQYAVKAGSWFCATTHGSYCFSGVTVAPGSHFANIDIGDKKLLLELYPHLRIHIEKFTKEPSTYTTQTPIVFNSGTAESDIDTRLSHSDQYGSSSACSSTP